MAGVLATEERGRDSVIREKQSVRVCAKTKHSVDSTWIL